MLQNKTAVITAAAMGIGRATVELFLENDSEVWALDINKLALDKLKQEFPAINIVELDVTNQSAINDFTATLNKVDILFNCAGYVHQGDILHSTEQEWDFAFNLNVKAMYYMISALLPKMLSKREGNIINMSSVASSIKGVKQRCIYGTTKAAVIGLTKSIAADYVTDNIRCNAICPGTVETPSLEQRINSLGDAQKARENFIARQPMGRLGTAEEIANLVLYLASDNAKYTTGQTHIIDGGWSI